VPCARRSASSRRWWALPRVGSARCARLSADADRWRHPENARDRELCDARACWFPNISVFGAVIAAGQFRHWLCRRRASSPYMSSLTSIGYKATQYALLSSRIPTSEEVREGFLRCDRRAGVAVGRPLIEATGCSSSSRSARCSPRSSSAIFSARATRRSHARSQP